MKPALLPSAVRPSARLLAGPHHPTTPTLPLFLLPQQAQKQQRSYAAQQQTPSAKRRAVTPLNDDGHVPWTDLSAGEKTGRAAQQSFNFGLVVLGVVLTGGVGYFLYTDIFSPDSKVAHFNRAVDRIKQDPRCLELLGDARSIAAYGEETGNKWRRARPIASTVRLDPQGNEHLLIHFNVEGPRNRGTVYIHLVKPPGGREHEYRHFYVDVPGAPRIYLENADAAARGAGGAGQRSTKLFGVNWGWGS